MLLPLVPESAVDRFNELVAMAWREREKRRHIQQHGSSIELGVRPCLENRWAAKAAEVRVLGDPSSRV